MDEARKEGFDLQRWQRVIWRRKLVLLAVVVLIPVAVYAISLQLPKSYRSSATLFVQPIALQATLIETPSGVGAADAEETATLLQTTLVARRAARILGRPPGAGRSLLGQIDVGPTNPADSDGDFLTITAQASSPVRAARIANAFATAVVRTRARSAVDNIDRTVAALSEARRRAQEEDDPATDEELVTQIQQLRGLKGNQAGLSSVVERAVPAKSAFAPKPLRNAILALLVSLLLAAGLVPFFDRLDRRLREPGELEELLEPPLLAAVPDDAFPGGLPDWHVREAFQTLRAALTYFNVDRPLSTLVVTSPAQWEGKTTVAVNLAGAYALDGSDVILVDADLRHPQVARRLGREAPIGLEAVLAGERTPREALIEVDAGDGRLRILPSVAQPPNPAALLGSQRMRSLLVELSGEADMVVIDTPALLAVSDAMPLVNQVAGSVLVARLNQTTREAARRADRVITAAGGSVLGTVLTGVRDGSVYGYYGYYAPPPRTDGPTGTVASPSSNGAGGRAPALAPEVDGSAEPGSGRGERT